MVVLGQALQITVFFRSKILAKLWCRRTAKKMIKLYKKPTAVWVESDDYKDESD